MSPSPAMAFRHWMVVLTSAGTAIVLGVVGYMTYLPTTTGYADATVLDALYYTAQMFVLASDPVVGSDRIPLTLEIARFLAPITTMIALIETVRAVLFERLRLWAAARAKGHVVVIGDDPVAHLLGHRFAADGVRVVLVSESAGVEPEGRHGVIVVRGDPTDEATLRSAGVGRAAMVYTCGFRSATNVAVALTVQGLTAGRTPVEAQVRDADMFAALRAGHPPGWMESDASVWLNFFVIEDLAARALLAREALVGGHRETDPIAVLGDGAFGRAIVRQLDRRRVGATRPESVPAPIVVADADVPDWRPPDLPGLRVHVCVADPDVALRAALDLGRTGVRRTVLCLQQDAALGNALIRSRLAERSNGRLAVFGILEAACDAAPRDHLDELGRAIHERYVALCRSLGNTPATNPSLVPWTKLPPPLKRSNRAQADHIGAKLAAIGCVIVPAVDGGEPFVFADGEVERLSRMEHDRWSAERRAAGLVYGPVREGRFHPDLVDWDELSEQARRKDIDAVEHLPTLLAEAGFHILRL